MKFFTQLITILLLVGISKLALALDNDTFNRIIFENELSILSSFEHNDSKKFAAIYEISQQKVIGTGDNTKTLLPGDIYFIRVNQEPAFEDDYLLGYISAEDLNRYILPNVAEYKYD